MLHHGRRSVRTIEIASGNPVALEPLTLLGTRPHKSTLATAVLCAGVLAGIVASGSMVLRHEPATTVRVPDSHRTQRSSATTAAVVQDPRFAPNRRRRRGRRRLPHVPRRPRHRRAMSSPVPPRQASPLLPAAPPAQSRSPRSPVPSPPAAPPPGGGAIDREFF